LGSDFNLRCFVSLLFSKIRRGGQPQRPGQGEWKFCVCRPGFSTITPVNGSWRLSPNAAEREGYEAGRKLIVRHAGIAAGWPRVRRQAAIRQVAGD